MRGRLSFLGTGAWQLQRQHGRALMRRARPAQLLCCPGTDRFFQFIRLGRHLDHMRFGGGHAVIVLHLVGELERAARRTLRRLGQRNLGRQIRRHIERPGGHLRALGHHTHTRRVRQLIAQFTHAAGTCSHVCRHGWCRIGWRLGALGRDALGRLATRTKDLQLRRQGART